MIILIGFPKSGTTSFQHLFTTLGLKSYHQFYNNKFIGLIIKKNKEDSLPLLTGMEDADAITQLDLCVDHTRCYWPQFLDYKQLYYENPDAVFILNKRNPEALLSSR